MLVKTISSCFCFLSTHTDFTSFYSYPSPRSLCSFSLIFLTQVTHVHSCKVAFCSSSSYLPSIWRWCLIPPLLQDQNQQSLPALFSCLYLNHVWPTVLRNRYQISSSKLWTGESTQTHLPCILNENTNLHKASARWILPSQKIRQPHTKRIKSYMADNDYSDCCSD